MATVHIEASKEQIAPRVLMPGDPNRAAYIATKYLENRKLVNKVRGELGYTGTYKGVPVTVFSSGMGIPSMGIYSYELFNDYDVDYIIRIGTMGSYTKDLKLFDLILADKSYSNTAYGKNMGYLENNIESSSKINEIIEETGKKCGINILRRNIHCTDTFYEKVWKGSMLGSNILGSVKTVESVTKESLAEHMKKFYVPERTVISISGNFDETAAVEICKSNSRAPRPARPP